MAIVLLAILLWTICLSLLARVLAIGFRDHVAGAASRALWCLLLAGAAVILFRPHEDIFGGQDQGAYANAAAAYASHKSTSFPDPLLSEVDASERSAFYYGAQRWFHGIADSKTGCLRVVDRGAEVELAPWFQPSYSLLMGAVSWMLPSRAMLYVSPLFGILTGLALAVLAGALLPRRGIPAAAFLLYIMNPNTLWHARSVRPEMAAGFLVIGAWVILIDVWRRRSKHEMADLIISAAAMSLAVMTHIVALFAVGPVVIWALVLMVRGFPKFIAFLYVSLIGAVVFLWQNIVVADGYRIGRVAARWIRHELLVLGVLVVGIACLAIVAQRRARRTDTPEASTARKPAWSHHLPALFLVLTLSAIFVAISSGWIAHGQPIALPGALKDTARITDIPAIVSVVSPWIALAALLGYAVLLLRPGPTRPERWAVALTLLPSMLLLDSMHYLMYYSRRAQTFFIPMIVLSLAALLALIPDRKKSRGCSAAFVLITLLIAGGGLAGRLHLLTGVEVAGLVRFAKPFAEEIRSHNGILLCDYSRLAAPFNYIFGIPTLSIDGDTQKSYQPAERAWDRIMRNRPDTPAYFMTLAQAPLSDRFRFEPVLKRTFVYKELLGRPSLPHGFRPREFDLALYRMRLAQGSGREFDAADFPLEVPIGAGGMGLRGYGPGRSKRWYVKGVACDPGQEITVKLTPRSAESEQEFIQAFVRVASAETELPAIRFGTQAAPSPRWTRLDSEWAVLLIEAPQTETQRAITLSGRSAFSLTDLHVLNGQQVDTIDLREHASQPRSHQKIAIEGRWADPISQILAPNGGQTGALVLVYARPGMEGQTLSFSCSETDLRTTYPDTEYRWQWFAYSTGAVFPKRDRAWIEIRTDPAFEPNRRGWPDPLGLLVGRIFVIPPP
ncbi:MAG: hypothetical protein O2923_13865 [Verrucomicrobia bacterium]|nr:hypothetical protein [Verrucomicrobiota bacterium]MDA1088020.1 hypothetical protein [Verrucomicrobiota bacterium]